MSEIKLTINGREAAGKKGETILQVAEREGISIPTLCHDPRLDPYSSCYLCVVEVEGMRGLQSSCSTRIMEGMKIQTENDKVRKARKTALDLLLSNHYADCMAPCKQTCPAGVDVQGYISLIEKGLYQEAIALVKEVNPLPAICGRVCVRPCEVACRRNLLGEGSGVGVDYLKRFAADYDLKSANPYAPQVKAETGKMVAVIGSGPGGLSTAYFLRREGHAVDIYEASPAAGGMLRYGIPEYRLPNNLLQREVDGITNLGVRIFYNRKLGENVRYKDLKQQYDAVILTIGSQKGTKVGCEGDDAHNVLAGIDYLRNMEMTGQRPDFSGKTVAVVGGGNTAMDCCRSAIRCGAKKVYIVYRRTEKEMPANPIEIHESKVEGVEYLFLTNPVRINKDENGYMKSMTCVKMQLGEPDASGRRRPEVVPGSEFDLQLDYALAAIGQKTDVDFINDFNDNSPEEKLEINRWGNLDADPKTLQTGIRSVFAAGDGVTGPATIIEAIAQAKIAARSCHQFLSGQELSSPKKEFLSKKDNFKEQVAEDYACRFENRLRQEMPVLESTGRMNFNEVELGYENEQVAQDETQRCLECGCQAYFTCDLKKFATRYDAEQQKYNGDFREYQIDFSHPFIEIDSNKCILCARCVRICNEVVGANALGLVNRGFDAYIAPSMGGSLTETDCESCGLCISTCPTGAITENFPFKPGPVLKESIKTICNYCSVGCEIDLHHKGGFFMEATGGSGAVNPEGNFCKYAKFGYHHMNPNGSGIKKPMKKSNGKFVEIGYDEAYQIIAEKIKSVSPDQNAFFAGARLTSEEMFLIRKLAVEGAKTDNLHSFNYLGREMADLECAPFSRIGEADKIILLGSEINEDHAVAGYMIRQAAHHRHSLLHVITEKENSAMSKKADKITRISSYTAFVNTAGEFLRSAVDVSNDAAAFALEVKNENVVVVCSEKYLSPSAQLALRDMIATAGKRPEECLVVLREKNNSEGLLQFGYGKRDMLESLRQNKFKNLFIFGEDPAGCAIDKKSVQAWLSGASFKVVQDHYMTETARAADLVLPASFPVITGGTYVNTEGLEQSFNGEDKIKKGPASFEQVLGILKVIGINGFHTLQEVKERMTAAKVEQAPVLRGAEGERLFEYGCDSITREFEEYFSRQF